MFLRNDKKSLEVNKDSYFIYDLEINTDYGYSDVLLYSKKIVKNGLVGHFDVDNVKCWNGKVLKSTEIWEKKVLSNFTINDIGLTGIDNGLVPSFSGETLAFTNGSTLELHPIKKNNYYNETTDKGTFKTKYDFSGLYLEQKNNIFQGFYKLDSYPFQVLPIRNERGFTYDFWVSPQFTNDYVPTGETVNEVYSGNKGIFFFQGVRAENKFQNTTGLTNYTTSTGVKLYDEEDKKLLIKNDTSSVSGQTYTGLAFQIKDNKIGYKSVIPLINDSEVTIHKIFSGYSEYNVFSGDTNSKWVNISIKFERNITVEPGCILENGEEPYDDVPCECCIPNSRKGTLTFYVNARPLYIVKNFVEPIFNKLLTDKTKQQGVAYNISLGGSVGLRYNQIINSDGNIIRDDEVSTLIEENFAGTFDGSFSQLKIYDRPLNVTEIIHNFKIEQKRYRRIENFGGDVIFINKPFI